MGEKAKAREDLLNDLNSDNSDGEEIDDDEEEDMDKKSDNEADAIMEEIKSKAADVSKMSEEIVMMSDNDGDHEDISDEDLSPIKKAKSKKSASKSSDAEVLSVPDSDSDSDSDKKKKKKAKKD